MGSFRHVGGSWLSKAVIVGERVRLSVSGMNEWEAGSRVIHCSTSTQKGNGARNDELEHTTHDQQQRPGMDYKWYMVMGINEKGGAVQSVVLTISLAIPRRQQTRVEKVPVAVLVFVHQDPWLIRSRGPFR